MNSNSDDDDDDDGEIGEMVVQALPVGKGVVDLSIPPTTGDEYLRQVR